MSDKKPNTVFPTNHFYGDYSSQIKPIKIHLPESKKGDKYYDFVGRGKLMERLYAWLTNNSSAGSYLVTVFRGMGKTILVSRVMDRLTRDISHKKELFCHISLVLLICAVFLFDLHCFFSAFVLLAISLIILFPFIFYYPWKYRIHAFIKRTKFPHGRFFNKRILDKIIQGKEIDKTYKKYSNIKISINLGHEILNERDILCMIAHDVKEKYTRFVKSIGPHFLAVYFSVFFVSVLSMFCVGHLDSLIWSSKEYQEKGVSVVQDVRILSNSQESNLSPTVGNHQGVSIQSPDTWMGRLVSGTVGFIANMRCKYPFFSLFILYALIELFLWWMMKKTLLRIPLLSTPQKAIKRLANLEERIVATTDEETGATSATDKNVVAISIFGHKKRKVFPIADVREIETELSDIINSISSKECV